MNNSADDSNNTCCCGDIITQFCGLNMSKKKKKKEELNNGHNNVRGVIIGEPTKEEVPCHGTFPDKIDTGSVIIVDGFVGELCTRFSINLTNTEDIGGDIAFHFNPRLDQHYIVRNYRANGKWGIEETTITAAEFPFQQGKKFRVYIVATEDAFLVSVDMLNCSGPQHLCGYSYRTPLRRVVAYEVHGDVCVNGVIYERTSVYPNPAWGPPTPKLPLGDSHLDKKMLNPCLLRLEGGFQVGHQIDIEGTVKLLPHSFYFNLQQGSSIWPHPVIPLHLNPRFNTVQGAHLLVRNTWKDGEWGSEERASGFQFIPGRPFHLAIRCEDGSYSVWVDDQLIAMFSFRMPPALVDTVYIQGDVNIMKIVHNDHFHERYFKPKIKKKGCL